MIITRGLGTQWLITRGYGRFSWRKAVRLMRMSLSVIRETVLNLFMPGEEDEY